MFSDSDIGDLYITAGAIAVSETQQKGKKKKKRSRRMWVRAWVQRRKMEGCCQKLLKELRSEEPSLHKNFVRMGSNDFDYLVIVLQYSVY